MKRDFWRKYSILLSDILISPIIVIVITIIYDLIILKVLNIFVRCSGVIKTVDFVNFKFIDLFYDTNLVIFKCYIFIKYNFFCCFRMIF